VVVGSVSGFNLVWDTEAVHAITYKIPGQNFDVSFHFILAQNHPVILYSGFQNYIGENCTMRSFIICIRHKMLVIGVISPRR
jgi:hypothetical protein